MTPLKNRAAIQAWEHAQMKFGEKVRDPEWYDWRDLTEEQMDRIVNALADRDPNMAGRLLQLAFDRVAAKQVADETGVWI